MCYHFEKYNNALTDLSRYITARRSSPIPLLNDTLLARGQVNFHVWLLDVANSRNAHFAVKSKISKDSSAVHRCLNCENNSRRQETFTPKFARFALIRFPSSLALPHVC
jgi:hypothetical protein